MKKWIITVGLLLFLAACNEPETNNGQVNPEGLGIIVECELWDADTLYNGGSTVIYEGAGYIANWWTLGDIPDGRGYRTAWEVTDVCDDVIPAPEPDPEPEPEPEPEPDPTPPTPAPEPQEGDMVVTLLGTGTPIPDPTRFGPATLVQVNGLNLLFDAGRGVPVRLNQVGVRSGDVDGIFLTHFHSDHVNGLPDVWMTGYLNAPFGGRQASLNLIGPVGTDNLATNLREAYEEDIALRIEGNDVPPIATEITSSEFEVVDGGEAVAFEQDGVTVTAFTVDHGPVNEPAVGYRVDFEEHSVLISGDTTVSPNLIENAQDLDLLIHEVAALPDALLEIPVFANIQSIHVTPEQGGDIFTETQPRFAAYSHIILLGTPDVPPLTVQDIEERTRTTYDGPLTIGEDLTSFIISDDDVIAIPSNPEGAE